MISDQEKLRRLDRSVTVRSVIHIPDLLATRRTQMAAPARQEKRYANMNSQYAGDLFMYRN
jgi:hypothetical protein